MDQTSFFDAFMPHGMCYAWNPQILLANVVSDAVIAFAYFCIPVALYYFFRSRTDFPFRNVILMFSLFIFTCGLSHIMGIITVWNGAYGLQGLIKIATAIASLLTAAMLVPVMPQLLALRSPKQLEIANDALTREIEERKQSERRTQRLIEAAPDAVIITDGQSRIKVVNSRAEEMFGYLREEMIKQPIDSFLLDLSASALGRDINESDDPALHSGSDQIAQEGVGIRYDGTHFPVEVSLSSVGSDENELYSHAIRNISKRIELEQQARSLEQQVAHVDRLDTMGLLAAGLAHEINQPLMALTQDADSAVLIAQRKENADPDLIGVLNDIEAHAHRAGNIIRALRQFVGNDDASRELFDLNELLRQTIRLVDNDAKMNVVDIQCELPHPCHVFGARVQIAQVFLNLLKNSIEAMVEAGSPNKRIAISAVPDDRFLKLTMEDNGPGIGYDQDVFKPFQSTKSEGMGMGLSICRSIVIGHGGTFSVDRNVETGARFVFTLPLSEV